MSNESEQSDPLDAATEALARHDADMTFYELQAIERRKEEQESAGTRPRTPATAESLNFAWRHVYVRSQLALAGLLSDTPPSRMPRPPESLRTVDQLNAGLYLAYSGQHACRDAANALIHAGSTPVSFDHSGAPPGVRPSAARLRKAAQEAVRKETDKKL
jgi:hypothetical protein